MNQEALSNKTIVRTNWENPAFQELVQELNSELAIRDGDDHAFYHQFNGIEGMKYCIVVFQDEKPLACGALKNFAPGIFEVKRMYVRKDSRNKGLARLLLQQLEDWAVSLDANKLVLETGKNQPEAIALYDSSGFNRTDNYGQYVGKDNSVCFEKGLMS